MALFNLAMVLLGVGTVCLVLSGLAAESRHFGLSGALIWCGVGANVLGAIALGLGIVEDLPMVAYRDDGRDLHIVDINDTTAVVGRRTSF